MPLRSPGVDGRSALQQLQYHDSSGERRCICIKTFADGSRGQTPLMLAAAHIGGGSTNAVETMKACGPRFLPLPQFSLKAERSLKPKMSSVGRPCFTPHEDAAKLLIHERCDVHVQFWLKSNFGSGSLLAKMSLRFLVALSALWSVTAKLLIQKAAPNFALDAAMPDDSTKSVSLQDYKNKYVILFFYPFDFTFVCPTEIMAFNSVVDDLRAKGAEVLGISTDSVHSHLAYRRLEPSQGGIGKIKFPLLSDFRKEASEAYDCACSTRCSTSRKTARCALPTSRGASPLNLWAQLRCLSRNDSKTWPATWAKNTATEEPCRSVAMLPRMGKLRLCFARWRCPIEGTKVTSLLRRSTVHVATGRSRLDQARRSNDKITRSTSMPRTNMAGVCIFLQLRTQIRS
eukprot:s326_g27.t3